MARRTRATGEGTAGAADPLSGAGAILDHVAEITPAERRLALRAIARQDDAELIAEMLGLGVDT